MAAWGPAALLPVAVESWLTQPAAIGTGEVALVIYLGAGCSALTYALWGYALRHLEAGRAGTFSRSSASSPRSWCCKRRH
jgi:drug/metabolite transporter (DMT)-like permease